MSALILAYIGINLCVTYGFWRVWPPETFSGAIFDIVLGSTVSIFTFISDKDLRNVVYCGYSENPKLAIKELIYDEMGWSL